MAALAASRAPSTRMKRAIYFAVVLAAEVVGAVPNRADSEGVMIPDTAVPAACVPVG